MLKIAKYLKPFVPLLVLAVGALFLQAFCDLNLPNLMSRLVNGILKAGGEDTNMYESGIAGLGFRMLLAAVTGGAAAIGVSFLSTRIAAGVARDLRTAVFEKVESFSSKEFDAFSTASLITRCTNDINQVQGIFMMGIRMICYAPIMGIGGSIMAFRKAPSMSWIIVLAVVFLISMIVLLISIVMPKFRLIQSLVDSLNRIARETLNGLMVIRAFGAEDYEKKRFTEVNQDVTRVNLFVTRIMTLQMPLMQFIMNTSILLIIWTGAHRIANSAMEVGDMMAFIQYTMQIIFSFLFFSMMFVMLPRTAVSADRIARVLETDVSVKDFSDHKDNHKAPASSGGEVEFRNVSFKYEGAAEYALRDVSFIARAGETTAIIGATGSGKSTIVNLILRFYDVSSGGILVDGKDVRDYSQRDLRDKIGYVPQKSILLSGPISFNLRYGKGSASEDELYEGARIAQALEFINQRKEGMEAGIAQGAANFSGGQKQRLSIARALIRGPEILIFDDSFSALDFATDARLRKALNEKQRHVTKIIVAQRVGTIMSAEKIIVLAKGEIIGIGAHRDLIKTCAEYREIAESQLSENLAPSELLS